MTAAFRASVVLDDLADAIALARPPLVVVTVPGPVTSAVTSAVASSTLSAVPRATARRSDLATEGALLARLEPCPGGMPGRLIAGELQWADHRSLDAIVERARRLIDGTVDGAVDGAPDGDLLVAVWRAGARRALLAELLTLAGEHGSVIEVVPHTEASLVGAGHPPEGAAALLVATGGMPDLVAAVAAGHDLVDVVTRRLDVLDDETRRAAELVAFGAPVGDPDVDALVVEGLLVPGRPPRCPEGVAVAVRRACPASRRGAIVDHAAATGDRRSLARHLLELGDRSPTAAGCYLDAARGAPDDTAVALARAAREAGADELAARVLAAAALVRAGRPAEALRELDGLDDVSVQPVRAAAWVQLGDPVAAAVAFDGAGEPGWAAVMRVASADPGQMAGAVPADDGSAAGLLAVSVDRWWSSAFERSDDVVTALASAARRQATLGAGGDPVLVADLAVRVAERLGEHAVADRLAAEAVATGGIGSEQQHVLALLLAAWVEARRGVLDDRTPPLSGASIAPRARLAREAGRCAAVVRDVDGGGLDAAVLAGTGAAAAVAPDLFDLDLRADVAAAAERARADHLVDPIVATEPLVARCGPSHRFDLAWCRLQASLAGDRLDRVADRARAVLALDPLHDRHRLAADIRALARIVVEPAGVRVAGEVVEVARVFAGAGMPHVAARLCGLVATATTDETTARLLLRESRTWRANRTRVRRASGVEDAVVRLSDQEERIGRMVLDGRTHKEIGAALFVSPKTVEHHVAHIRTKLGVTSRAEMMSALRDYLG